MIVDLDIGRKSDYIVIMTNKWTKKGDKTMVKRKSWIYWAGTEPTICQLCNFPIEGTFVDGIVKKKGSWAVMCIRCHTIYGIGLGTGKGQRYAKEEGSKIYYKSEG